MQSQCRWIEIVLLKPLDSPASCCGLVASNHNDVCLQPNSFGIENINFHFPVSFCLSPVSAPLLASSSLPLDYTQSRPKPPHDPFSAILRGLSYKTLAEDGWLSHVARTPPSPAGLKCPLLRRCQPMLGNLSSTSLAGALASSVFDRRVSCKTHPRASPPVWGSGPAGHRGGGRGCFVDCKAPGPSRRWLSRQQPVVSDGRGWSVSYMLRASCIAITPRWALTPNRAEPSRLSSALVGSFSLLIRSCWRKPV